MSTAQPRPSIGAPTADPRRWWALVALSLLLLLIAIDATVLILAIPEIAADLGTGSTGILWVSDVYSFVLGGLLILMGNLGDRIGRKRLLMIGMVAFAITSAFAAFAPTTGALITARALQGLAGATLMPSTLSLLRSTFHTPKERTFALGVWAAMGSSGAAIGPLVGGFLLEHFWWGSVFLINVPIVAVTVPFVLWSVRESSNPSAGPIDVPSALMSIVGIVTAVYGVKEIARYGITDVAPWVALVVGGAIVVVFVRRQRRLPYPLVDVELFRQRALSGALTAILLSIFGVVGLLFFLSLYLQTVESASPLESGFQLVPLVVASSIAAVCAAPLVARLGRRTVATAALTIEATGLALSLNVLADGVGPSLVLAMVLVGIGDGLALTTLVDSVLAAAPVERAGAASAVSETMFELGNALGLALIGSVVTFTDRWALTLPGGLSAADDERAGDSVTGAVAVADDLGPPDADAVLEAAFDAFHVAFGAAASIAAALMLTGAVVVRLTLPSRDAERRAAAAAADAADADVDAAASSSPGEH
jgi:DHA2 family multidrug resistance protein-like MFS transporter